MVDPGEVSKLSDSIQVYATLAGSLVLGVITVLGYYKTIKPTTDDPMRRAVRLLSQVVESTSDVARGVRSVEAMMAAAIRQGDLDRAYDRGRHEKVDRAAARLAGDLRDGA